MSGKPIKLEPMALYRGTCFETHLGPGVTWMHVQEYDFNDPRGHFFVKKEEVDWDDQRWPDVGDLVMLVCTEAGDSFGCVVIVTRAEDSVRDGYVRYETDLGQRMALAREEADGPRAECGDRGPRIGSEGKPVCRKAPGHEPPHAPSPDDGWGNVEW